MKMKASIFEQKGWIRCPKCGRLVKTKDGKIVEHGSNGVICKGK